MIYKSIYSSPLGFLEICADGGEKVTRIYFTSTPSSRYTECESTRRAAEQLAAYFQGSLTDFTVPLAPEGTAFEQQVWEACRNIPYGETRTYKEIAAAIGDEKAARKAGQAVEKNPVAILIPTHRVKGKLSLLGSISSQAAIHEALRGAEKNFLKNS